MIGLELNDTGIMAVGPDGTLLEPEPGVLASPGIVVIEAGKLQVGKAAEKRCRLLPRQVNHHFWDKLASDPLEHPAFTGWTHADMAHAHLSRIWGHLSPSRGDVLVAVPDTFTTHQLELLAGIMTALSIPVRGFVASSLGTLGGNAPAEILLHLELYRHRTVLTVLDNRREPAVRGVRGVENMGLDRLKEIWMKVIADEFVRRTRFDPFHAAETEQDLYDRLPDLLTSLGTATEIDLEIATSEATHGIQLKREPMENTLEPLMDAIHRQFSAIKKDLFNRQKEGTVLVSSRAAGLPGFCERLEASIGLRPRPVSEGAALTGLLALEGDLPRRQSGQGIPVVNRIALEEEPPMQDGGTVDVQSGNAPPAATHLLYRHRGYPITERPLFIGRESLTDDMGILIHGHTEGVSRVHCHVTLREGIPVLTDTSTYGTFVDEVPVKNETPLKVGQTIRVGTPGEQLQVIACLDSDETPNT